MNTEEDEIEIDNILANLDKKKKINGKKKGNRVELQLTKILTSRFELNFSRTVSSGARWSQAKLSEDAKNVFSGDLVVCKGFKFVIECKGGYDDIDLNSSFIDGSKEIDAFLTQVTDDSKRCNRKPMLCWKKTRKPWLVFIHKNELNNDQLNNIKYYLTYNQWICLSLEELLKLENSFFID